MKRYAVITLFLLSNTVCLMAQNGGKPFTLEGKLTGEPKDSAKLNYTNAAGKNTVATVPIKDGRFKITGDISGIRPAMLSFTDGSRPEATDAHGQKPSRTVFLEPATLTVSGDPWNIKEMTIEGSATQNDLNDYNRMLEPLQTEVKALTAAAKKETDSAKRAGLKTKIAELDNRQSGKIYDFFVSRPHSYLTLSYMQLYSAVYSVDSIKNIYNLFNEQQKNSAMGKAIAGRIEGMEAGSVGKTAMDFKTTDINGKPIALSDFKGRYVVLDFWASWCVPCRKSHPHLLQWYARYKSNGLEIIGIASDDGREAAWKEAVAKDGIGIWRHVLSGFDQKKAMNNEPNPADIMAKYGVGALPTKLIVDPSGKIVARDVGDGSEIGEKLDAIFSKK